MATKFKINDIVSGVYLSAQKIIGIITDIRFSTVEWYEVTYTVMLNKPIKVFGSIRDTVLITLDTRTGLGDEQSLSLIK